MINAMLSSHQVGLILLDAAARAGQPFTDVLTYEDINGDVKAQLTSRKSAKGWKGVISKEERTMHPSDFADTLQKRWPETFGQPVDPKEEKRAQIQLLTRNIAASAALIAQQMAHLTKLIAELE